MDEKVFAATIGCNESKAFRGVEPFDGSPLPELLAHSRDPPRSISVRGQLSAACTGNAAQCSRSRTTRSRTRHPSCVEEPRDEVRKRSVVLQRLTTLFLSIAFRIHRQYTNLHLYLCDNFMCMLAFHYNLPHRECISKELITFICYNWCCNVDCLGNRRPKNAQFIELHEQSPTIARYRTLGSSFLSADVSREDRRLRQASKAGSVDTCSRRCCVSARVASSSSSILY